MIQRLGTATGGLDEDTHLLAHGFLADVILQPLGAYGAVYGFVVGGFGGGDESFH